MGYAILAIYLALVCFAYAFMRGASILSNREEDVQG